MLYAVDAKIHVLMSITAAGGVLSSGGPTIVLESDVLEGPVRSERVVVAMVLVEMPSLP